MMKLVVVELFKTGIIMRMIATMLYATMCEVEDF